MTALLKTGRSRHAAVAGPMSEVVTHSTQYLSDGDLNAIAVYLRSLAPETAAKAAAPAVQANNPGGKATYAMYCSTCHGNKGEGTDFAIPALAGNATVTADNPLTALRVVLEGAYASHAARDGVRYAGLRLGVERSAGGGSDELSAGKLGQPGGTGDGAAGAGRAPTAGEMRGSAV